MLLALLAAKKGKGRRRRRYLKGNLDFELDLGTLAANALVSGILGNTVTERTLVSSVVATWALSDMTINAGDGPILCGVAHSDYSDAEIEAVIENTGAWAEGDLIAQEIAKRKVRQIGKFDQSSSEGGVFSGASVLNEGRPIKTKLNWILTTGQTLRFWAYNTGDSALATTDPDMTVNGHANLWPQ